MVGKNGNLFLSVMSKDPYDLVQIYLLPASITANCLALLDTDLQNSVEAWSKTQGHCSAFIYELPEKHLEENKKLLAKTFC